MNYALIFAGGSGKRMNSKSRPKQFLELHGKEIIIYTIEHFEKLRSREIERLRVSLEMAKKAGYQKFTGMIFGENETKDVLCFFML